MSVINYTSLNELENQHQIRSAKQFGAPDATRSAMKKKALADVKNTLTQKDAYLPKKELNSAVKLNVSKKHIFGVFNDKENQTSKRDMIKQVGTSSQSIFVNEAINDADDEFVEPVCKHCEKEEDDFADAMFKNIRLSKSAIEKLALVWENPPDVSEKDIRKLDLNLSPVPDVDIVNSMSEWHPILCDVEQLDLDILNDIPPFVCGMYDSDYEE